MRNLVKFAALGLALYYLTRRTAAVPMADSGPPLATFPPPGGGATGGPAIAVGEPTPGPVPVSTVPQSTPPNVTPPHMVVRPTDGHVAADDYYTNHYTTGGALPAAR